MDQRQTSAQKNRAHTVIHMFHIKDCSQQLRWCLTCRQHQQSSYYLLSHKHWAQLSKDTKTCKKQHTATLSLCRPSLTHRSISEWSSAKALDPKGNLGQGWNQRHASKTERQNNQGQKAVLHCRARTGTHMFWVKAYVWADPQTASGTRPATSQPCFPTPEAATGSITSALCHKEPLVPSDEYR